MSTMVIGAHPDDEVLGLGGTIAKMINEQKESVYVLIVTDGSSTQYPGDAEKREQKDKELKNCCQKLGVTEFAHGDWPDMKLDGIPHHELNDFIGKYIAKWQPDTIYTHFPDINKDHVRIYDSTLVATRPVPGSSIKKLVLYPTPSSTEWSQSIRQEGFNPNEFIDISNYIDTKIAAYESYATEIRDFPHPRSIDAVKSYAQTCGIKVGVPYAEEFMVVRHIQ